MADTFSFEEAQAPASNATKTFSFEDAHIGAAPATTPPSPQHSWLTSELLGAGAGAGAAFGEQVLGAQELIGHGLAAVGFEDATSSDGTWAGVQGLAQAF